MNTNKILNEDEITAGCTYGVNRKKVGYVRLKITLPEDAVDLANVMSRYGKIPTIEEYLIEGGRDLLLAFLAKAEAVLSGESAEEDKEK